MNKQNPTSESEKSTRQEKQKQAMDLPCPQTGQMECQYTANWTGR